jgi:hypothetical protein
MEFFLLALVAFFVGLNYFVGGWALVAEGLGPIRDLVYTNLLLIAVVLITTGEAIALFRNPVVVGYVKNNLGFAQSLVASMLAPGAYVLYPMIGTQWNMGGDKFMLLFCLLASSTVNGWIYFIRMAFLGPRLVLISFLFQFSITVIIGIIMVVVQKIAR